MCTNVPPISVNKDIMMTVDIFGFDLAMESADLIQSCTFTKLLEWTVGHSAGIKTLKPRSSALD